MNNNNFGKDNKFKNMDFEMKPNTTMTDSTMIFEGIRFQGDVQGSHDFFLMGEIEGTIDLTALMTIGKTGKFKGEIKAKRVIIEGEVEGKVSAKEKVEVRDGGKHVGDIIAPAVLISDQAYFQGNVMMVQDQNSNRNSQKNFYNSTTNYDVSKIKVVDENETDTNTEFDSEKKNTTSTKSN